MEINMKNIILVVIVGILLVGCRDHDEEITTYSNVIYYGDVNSDMVIGMDVESMSLKSIVASNGVNPYEITAATNNDLYVINRTDYNIGFYDSSINRITSEISLNFMPRSLSIQGSDMLISSVNEPSEAVVSDDTLSDTYSDSTYIQPTSFGGSNATGHPIWIDEQYFLLLDRTENTIELYKKGVYQPVSKVTTSSSVHHVMNRDGLFYGILEGIQGGTAPGVIKFTVSNGQITVLLERLLSEFSGMPVDFQPATWGSHHGALHPSTDYIYLGSAEGNVFVLDLATLNLADTFVSGKGIGHFLFYNDILITTNHYDNFKSFYDATQPTANRFIKNLYFSMTTYSGITMQSHTTHVLDGYLYFVFNTDVDSTLFKINLSTLEVTDSLLMPGRYLLMGSVVSTSLTTDGM